MVGHGGSSAGSYLADPTSPIPSHCASIVATKTLRVKPSLSKWKWSAGQKDNIMDIDSEMGNGGTGKMNVPIVLQNYPDDHLILLILSVNS